MRPYLNIPLVMAIGCTLLLSGCGGGQDTAGLTEAQRKLPDVIEARAISAKRVLVEFAEPAGAAAELPASYVIVGPDSWNVTVKTVDLDDARTEATLTTVEEFEDGATYELMITGRETVFEILPLAPPRVVGAISTSNTTVTVTFSRKMGDSAEVAENYFIVQENVGPEAGALAVTDAAFLLPQKDAVELTTLPQNEVTYELHVVNVVDAWGSQMAPPELLVDPSRATFRGSPITCENLCTNGSQGTDGNGACTSDDDCDDDAPCDTEEVDCEHACVCSLVDSDGDGLPDHVEQRGWAVTVELTARTGLFERFGATSRDVTSDPFVADTDGDGLSDFTERELATDPRDADTDADGLDDNAEFNMHFSSPVDQDTDEDQLDDFLEVYFFNTSPILADTDGDGLDDDTEILELSRNPRVADLPRPAISVGNMRMVIDERYTTTNEQGESISMESSSNTTLTQSQDRTFASAETDMTSKSREMFIKAGLGADFSATVSMNPSATASISASLEGGVTWKQHSEHTSQFSAESTVAAQQVYEQSLAKGRELSRTTTVTRDIFGARADVDLTIENAGEIAFAITNIEISMLQSTGLSRTSFVPIGTLVPNSALISGDEPTFNLGPFTEQIGPLVFGNRDIFPQEVDALLREPRGLIFRVANYDLIDEFGRNFAFASQTARDRNAGITIDYGDGTVDRFLVATAGAFDVAGYVGGGFIGGFDSNNAAPLGLPLDFILQDTLRMTKNGTTPDAIVAGGDGEADSLADGDDIQLVPQLTTGLTDDTIVISAGANGVLDTTPLDDDEQAVTTGYATSATCNTDTPLEWDPEDPDILLSGPGFACESDADCGEVVGACSGREVLVRVRNRRLGDFNRVWAVFSSGLIPAGADFGSIVMFPGEDITMGFIQDLDRDGLFAREEYLYGSSDRDKDSDTEGLGDFAEVRIGWDVGVEGQEIRRVLPDPRVPDSDGDGLTDMEEQDLRRLWCRCNSSSDNAGEACGDDGGCPGGSCNCNSCLCFHSDNPGEACEYNEDCPNGFCWCTQNIYVCSGGDDDGLPCSSDDSCASAATCISGTPTSTCCWQESTGPGCDDAECEALVCAITPSCCTDVWWQWHNCALVARDLCSVCAMTEFGEVFNGASPSDGPMRSDPRNPDTDSDGVSDMEEIAGYLVGVSVRDPASGGNGTADTQALSDDVQKVFVGQPVGPSRVVILPGPNAVIDSALGPDDVLDPGTEVVTNPLNPDHDGDTRPDGFERDAGSSPTDPNDSDDFVDSDRDGMSDAAEEDPTSGGWDVETFDMNGNSEGTVHVFSSKFVADTDFDGLPDLLERELRTNPTRADTDGDGLDDYDEFAQFTSFIALNDLFPGFLLDGTGSLAVGTSPIKDDTDGDGLSDHFEATEIWAVLVNGELLSRASNPLLADTDSDGATDLEEYLGEDGSPPPASTDATDPTDPDTDGDGTFDGVELPAGGSDPLVKDLVVGVRVLGLFVKEKHSPEDAQVLWAWEFTAEIPGVSPAPLEFSSSAEFFDCFPLCPGTSNCCSAHGGTGCDNALCEETVCRMASHCCLPGQWNTTCRSLAIQNCGAYFGSEPTCQPSRGLIFNTGSALYSIKFDAAVDFTDECGGLVDVFYLKEGQALLLTLKLTSPISAEACDPVFQSSECSVTEYHVLSFDELLTGTAWQELVVDLGVADSFACTDSQVTIAISRQ